MRSIFDQWGLNTHTHTHTHTPITQLANVPQATAVASCADVEVQAQNMKPRLTLTALIGVLLEVTQTEHRYLTGPLEVH